MVQLVFALILFSLFAPSFAPAQEMPFEGMGQLNQKARAEVMGFHQGQQTINFNRLNVKGPVHKSETHSTSVATKFTQVNLPTGIVIPESNGLRVPSTLSTAEVGLSYTKMREENRSVGGGATYGSSSDQLFRSGDVITLSANLFYSFPAEKNPEDRWIVSLFYSNNNPLFGEIPLPGFAYFFKRPQLTGAVGAPFVFTRWTPTEPWAVTFFALGTILKTELSHGPFFFQRYVGFDWNQQTWLRYDRENRKSKLYFEDKRLYVGLRFPLRKGIFSDFQIGQSFDRALYEAEGFSDKTTGIARLPASGYALWSFKFDL